MKSKLNLTIVLCFVLILGAHGYSKSKDANEDEKAEISKKTNFLTVRNVWKDMPSYDRYGNEITPRARYNMRQNAILENLNKNKSTETGFNREKK